ncbi:MAG TPA: gamma carbonic anhydrase family protein [Candidatus Mcinerneyibacterium sp.]|nr:gamma carbonic anhydrase family protein [Candidatus Mcinerneyibacterium sp.]
MIEAYKDHYPDISENTYIHDSSVIIGNVKIEKNVSIWPNVTIRGDVNFIKIGQYTNIQDNSVVHVAGEYPTVLGDYITVGHNVILHACKIKNNSLIGMGATILDGVEIGENCIIGANSLVTKNTKIPQKSLVLGSPAKIIRKLNDEEVENLKNHSAHYWELASDYLKMKGK